MRNGDAAKIVSMVKTGYTDKQIIERFRNEYDAKEVKAFIPKRPRAAKKDSED